MLGGRRTPAQFGVQVHEVQNTSEFPGVFYRGLGTFNGVAPFEIQTGYSRRELEELPLLSDDLVFLTEAAKYDAGRKTFVASEDFFKQLNELSEGSYSPVMGACRPSLMGPSAGGGGGAVGASVGASAGASVGGGGASVGVGPQPGSMRLTILKTTTRNKTFFSICY